MSKARKVSRLQKKVPREFPLDSEADSLGIWCLQVGINGVIRLLAFQTYWMPCRWIDEGRERLCQLGRGSNTPSWQGAGDAEPGIVGQRLCRTLARSVLGRRGILQEIGMLVLKIYQGGGGGVVIDNAEPA